MGQGSEGPAATQEQRPVRGQCRSVAAGDGGEGALPWSTGPGRGPWKELGTGCAAARGAAGTIGGAREGRTRPAKDHGSRELRGTVLQAVQQPVRNEAQQRVVAPPQARGALAVRALGGPGSADGAARGPQSAPQRRHAAPLLDHRDRFFGQSGRLSKALPRCAHARLSKTSMLLAGAPSSRATAAACCAAASTSPCSPACRSRSVGGRNARLSACQRCHSAIPVDRGWMGDDLAELRTCRAFIQLD